MFKQKIQLIIKTYRENGLPYQITKPNDEEIEIVGLLVKCTGFYDAVWTVTELNQKELVLVNYEID